MEPLLSQISVVIVTRNRHKKLFECLRALAKSTVKAFDVVVIDQSEKTNSFDLTIFSRKFTHFSHVYMEEKGKSRGLNKAIALCSTPYLAFTDDDCVPDKDWLAEVLKSFAKQTEIGGVFGRTLPYQPILHKGEICPCTFSNRNSRVISSPGKHWKTIGFGNNMALRRDVLAKVGGFKEWLGPGSIGSNAEDAEIALRIITRGGKLYYNHKMTVCHNRWMSTQEDQRQQLSYICGEIACYGTFSLRGFSFAKKVVKESLLLSKKECVQTLRAGIHMKKVFFPLFAQTFLRILMKARGCIVALYFHFSEEPEEAQQLDQNNSSVEEYIPLFMVENAVEVLASKILQIKDHYRVEKSKITIWKNDDAHLSKTIERINTLFFKSQLPLVATKDANENTKIIITLDKVIST